MLTLAPKTPIRTLLLLGAHCDDIEIGCGGTVMRLIVENPGIVVRYVVFSGDTRRHAEARAAAGELLKGAGESRVEFHAFRDAYFHFDATLKDAFESIKRDCAPDLILTHRRDDAHQDHRAVNALTWNTWRDHLILEYEIPKWDGDLGQPNFYSSLPVDIVDRKIDILLKHFPSQSAKHWFDAETFKGLLRLRGLESNTKYAEAFFARKVSM